MMKLVPPRTIALCLLASVLIHLVGLAAVDELLDVRGPDWYYPARFPGAVYHEGLWGVEVGGDLVAILSDLQLLNSWQTDGNLDPDREPPTKSLFLQAVVNIVLYALTRPAGLTAKRDRPLWAAATGVTRMISGAQPF
jgi:hypothetical protein